ncbi:hypothetical protein SGUI_0984 [Serinicoccus hydrothermalis]|uniref:Uncharacterized protein n=1 Tax=Serinicoccus hydrothermalis TaxID=1758689 RepID=A0A1B1NAA8_9MICO|nr:hypothetical protein SGUI_0984 [Serinicoccus hydrothermalis]
MPCRPGLPRPSTARRLGPTAVTKLQPPSPYRVMEVAGR